MHTLVVRNETAGSLPTNLHAAAARSKDSESRDVLPNAITSYLSPSASAANFGIKSYSDRHYLITFEQRSPISRDLSIDTSSRNVVRTIRKSRKAERQILRKKDIQVIRMTNAGKKSIKNYCLEILFLKRNQSSFKCILACVTSLRDAAFFNEATVGFHEREKRIDAARRGRQKSLWSR